MQPNARQRNLIIDTRRAPRTSGHEVVVDADLEIGVGEEGRRNHVTGADPRVPPAIVMLVSIRQDLSKEYCRYMLPVATRHLTRLARLAGPVGSRPGVAPRRAHLVREDQLVNELRRGLQEGSSYAVQLILRGDSGGEFRGARFERREAELHAPRVALG